MVYIKLQEFLLFPPVRKAISRLQNSELLATQVRISGFNDKIMLTTHNVQGQTSSEGFKLEKITNTIFAILPKNLTLLKN